MANIFTVDPLRHETAIFVRRPIQAVWAFLTNPEILPRWAPAWVGARLTSSGPIGPGTTFRSRRAFMGLGVPWTGEITEWDPPRAFGYAVIVLGARSEVRLALESTPDGTTVVRTARRQPRLAQRIASRVLGPLLIRHHQARDESLRRLLEADDPSRCSRSHACPPVPVAHSRDPRVHPHRISG